MSIQLIDPEDSDTFDLDWSESLADGITLASVTHTLPSPLTKVSESNNDTHSFVRISGAKHSELYQIEATATLSDGRTVNRNFTLRCFNG